MHITIAAVGPIREKWIAEGIRDYTERLKRLIRLDIIEVKSEPAGAASSANQIRLAVEKEGERLLSKWPKDCIAAAMDPRGRPLSSENLADHIDRHAVSGSSRLLFVTGGSHGLPPAVLARCRDRFSLGPATFPRQLFRVILLEQIYRAAKIRAGHAYHK